MSHLRRAVQPGLAAVREHKIAFATLVVLAWVLAAVYYMVPAVTEFANQMSLAKTRGGMPFSAISTAIACVFIPEVVKKFSGHKATPLRDFPFLLVFWAGVGIMVDLLYANLAQIIGAGTDPRTVVLKVLVDQFIFSTLITMPYGVSLMAWRDAGYSARKAAKSLGNGEFWRRWISTLVTCWAFWIPTVAAIFALPGDVKFLMFLIMEGTWSLLLLHILAAKDEISVDISSHNKEPEAGVA